METTSHTLLRAVQVGPESPAWQRFVALYTPLLRRWALGRGFQPADAEDLVQEIVTVHGGSRELASAVPILAA